MERNQLNLVEYEALWNGAGSIPLHRGKIALAGDDRVRWLHGMVTNDVKSLAPGEGCYAFVLDAQGHVLADLNVYMEAERILVDCDASLTAKLMEIFDRYIIMDQVEMSDVSAEMDTLAVEGPAANSIVTGSYRKLSVPRGVWLFGKDIQAPGATPVSAEAYETARIEAGIPRYGVDIDESVIANETGVTRAMHFNKGCYIGQEIVERIRSRGHVNRILAGFRADSPIPCPATFDAGRITSAALSPILHRTVALGYVRRELAAPGSKVSIAGIQAEVVAL